MVGMIILCWIIPFLALSVLFYSFFYVRNIEKNKETILSSIVSVTDLCQANLDKIYEESLNASYDGLIRKAYEKYLKDGDEYQMHKQVTNYLNSTYKYSKLISNTIILYSEDVKLEYYTYSNVAGATYRNIDEFTENTKEVVKAEAESLGTGAKLVYNNGHLYVVRNLVRSNYQPFATIVMEVNTGKCFDALSDVIYETDGEIYLDGGRIFSYTSLDSSQDIFDAKDSIEEFYNEKLINIRAVSTRIIKGYDRERAITYGAVKFEDQTVVFVASLDSFAINAEIVAFRYLFFTVVVSFIVLTFAIYYFFKKNINRPIGKLVDASQKIGDGEYGFKIETYASNYEMHRLVDNFNNMSEKLNKYFNEILAEEVAVRDARLKALQSQINPHFLNNTLEIINWQARMSGNDNVSEMIEALSTVMNAALDRENKPEVLLKDELEFVQAFVHIIKARFGDRFIFEEDVKVDSEAYYIPRLIIQPLIENVVEHGRDDDGKIYGSLEIYADDEFLNIIIKNRGSLSDEDREKIEGLLAGAIDLGDNHNIGIRNVHQRLQIMYGQRSGLSVYTQRNVVTVCQLKIELAKIRQKLPI